MATYSQIFQNRNNLTQVYVMDPYSPYYRTFQDPRYGVHATIAYLKNLWNISE